tara:strand:- start:87 stop:713 length:627 start_codon:yes stop_codon:yes gene_type:complete
MAEKKKTTKKKNPRFGGKRDLKDMDKSGGISFGDTFLGDLLGFDKDGMGLQGRAGLLKSLKGARRKKPGTATTTKKKPIVKKKTVTPKKPAVKGPVRRGDGTGAGTRTRAKVPEGRKINMKVPPRIQPVGPGKGPRQDNNPNAPRKGPAQQNNPNKDKQAPKPGTLSEKNLRKFRADPNSLTKREKDRLFKTLKRQNRTIPRGLKASN